MIGLIRIRNEGLILQDTLDHMAEFCETIILYDDASDDNSREIYSKHPAVSVSLKNEAWNPNQMSVQTFQRHELFEYAKFKYPNEMFFYQDADERIDIDWTQWDGKSAITMRLFDARMTECDYTPYVSGKLKNFRTYYEKQYRDIPFVFSGKAKYLGVMCERYPDITGQDVINLGHVQHYGKALSVDHWQSTCDYYSKYVPEYAEKWEKRKQESGIVSSDGLLTWRECLLN